MGNERLRRYLRLVLALTLGLVAYSGVAAARDAPHIGLKIKSLSPQLRKERQLGEDIKGVLVTGVTAGSAAQDKGISVGEVIVEAGGRQVRAPKDVAAQVAAKRGSAEDSIALVLVNAKGERREANVPLPKGTAGTKPILPGPR